MKNDKINSRNTPEEKTLFTKCRIFFILFFLLLLFLLLIFSGINFFQLSKFKSLNTTISNLISRQVNLACSIDGPIKINFFPTPSLTVYEVSFNLPQQDLTRNDINYSTSSTNPIKIREKNISQSANTVATVAAIKVKLNLFALLFGKIEFSALILEYPVVNLTVLKGIKKQETDNNIYIIELIGGQILTENADEKATVLIDNLNFKSNGGEFEITCDVFNPALSQSPPVQLKGTIFNLNVQNDIIKAELEIESKIFIENQIINPKIKTGVMFNLKDRRTVFSDIKFNLEKLLLQGEAVLLFSKEKDWQIKGFLKAKDLSLARWFSFARQWLNSLQMATGDLTADFAFDLSAASLNIADLNVYTMERKLSGFALVQDFSRPVIEIDVTADKLLLEDVFPELRHKKTNQEQDYFSDYHDVAPIFLDGEDSSLPDIGYAIKIKAKELDFRDLPLKDVAVDILPQQDDIVCKVFVENFAEGQLESEILIKDKHLEIVSLVQQVDLLATFNGLWQKKDIEGFITGKVNILGSGVDIFDFFEHAAISTDLEVQDAVFPLRLVEENTSKVSENDKVKFSALGIKIDVKSTDNQKINEKELEKDEIAFTGDWNFTLQSEKYKADAKIDGTIFFKTKTPVLYVSDAKLSLAFKTTAAELGFIRPLEGTMLAKLKVLPKFEQIELSSLKASLFDSVFSGDVQIFIDDSCKGKIKIESNNFRRFLTEFDIKEEDLPKFGLKNLNAEAKFTISRNELSLINIAGLLDEVDFNSELKLFKMNFHEVKVKTNFKNLNLDFYYPRSKTKNMYSSSPWNFASVKQKKLNMDIVIDHLLWRDFVFTDFTATIKSNKDEFTLPIEAKFYNGILKANFSGRIFNNYLDIVGEVTGKGIAFENPSLLLFKTIGVSAPLDFRFKLLGKPQRTSELVSAFSGSWNFSIDQGYYYRLMNKEQNAIKPEIAANVNSKTSFSKIIAQGIIQKGVMRIDTFLFDAPVFLVNGTGKVDLVKDNVDLKLDLQIAKMSIPLVMKGDFETVSSSFQSKDFVLNNIKNLGTGVFNVIEGILTAPLNILRQF